MKILLIPIFFLSVSGFSQTIVPADKLTLELLNDSMQITTGDSLLTVSVKVMNHSENTALLYGYYSNQIRPNRKLTEFCDAEKLGAGIAVFVWNSKGLQHFAAKYFSPGHKYIPMTSDSLQLRMAKARERYLKGTKVLKGSGISIDDFQIDLKKFELKPGFYKLCLVYFSGRMVEKLTVGKEQVMIDKKGTNGLLLEGCSNSNLITFSIL